MTIVGASALHVGVGSGVDVAIRLGFAVGATMGTIAVSPAVFWWESGSSATVVAASTSFASTTTASAASAATAATAAATCLCLAVDLGLEGCDCCGEGLDLFHHVLIVLGGICHVV